MNNLPTIITFEDLRTMPYTKLLYFGKYISMYYGEDIFIAVIKELNSRRILHHKETGELL